MRVVRVAMAVVGLLLAAICIALGLLAGATLFDPPEGGGVAGAITVGAVAVILVGGGAFLGYVFVRAAIRMKPTKVPDGQSAVRRAIGWFVVTASGLLLWPIPVALRVFVLIGLVVLFFVHLARDAEPPVEHRHRRRGRPGGEPNA